MVSFWLLVAGGFYNITFLDSLKLEMLMYGEN
jgi:hypothetical protein